MASVTKNEASSIPVHYTVLSERKYRAILMWGDIKWGWFILK